MRGRLRGWGRGRGGGEGAGTGEGTGVGERKADGLGGEEEGEWDPPPRVGRDSCRGMLQGSRDAT